MMGHNGGFYTRFKELFTQADSVAEDMKALTAEAKMEGIKDIATLKKHARLSVKGKLQKERDNYRKLKQVADDVDPGSFDL